MNWPEQWSTTGCLSAVSVRLSRNVKYHTFKNGYAMAFKVKITNIGKLADAEIHIGDFTVFAGPNNTGKSFVSKLLYSLFNAMNANHAETYLNNLLEPVKNTLWRLMAPVRHDRGGHYDKAIRSWQSSLDKKIKKLETLAKEASIEAFDNENIIFSFLSQIETIEQTAADVPQSFLKTMDKVAGQTGTD